METTLSANNRSQGMKLMKVCVSEGKEKALKQYNGASKSEECALRSAVFRSKSQRLNPKKALSYPAGVGKVAFHKVTQESGIILYQEDICRRGLRAASRPQQVCTLHVAREAVTRAQVRPGVIVSGGFHAAAAALSSYSGDSRACKA